MSALLGLFAPSGTASASDATVCRLLAAMPGRGRCIASWRGQGAVLALAQHPWEMRPGLGGSIHAPDDDDDAVVVADAALYYRDDLRATLAAAGAEPHGDVPADLIAAAYHAWGDRCVERLEGDFAFVLWDRRRHRVLCARDFVGRRPLYYALLGDVLVVASSMTAIVAHPGCSSELDPVALADTCAGFMGAAAATAYRAISRVPGGHVMTREAGAATRVSGFWDPPVFESTAGCLPFDEAAFTLRDLLARAVDERLAPDGSTAVWMSGGWDSPAVFGAGQHALAHAAAGRTLRPVSISYPPGDPGREDELITSIAERWAAEPRWISIDEIPLFERPTERAATRDEPVAHVYELWNRALARATRDVGASVALDGIGGDGLFSVSPVFLADLFTRGRWVALGREWRGGVLRGRGARRLVHWAVEPALPDVVLRLATLARGGRRIPRYLDRPLPPWIPADFARRHDLAALGRPMLRSRRGESHSARETQLHLTMPWMPALLAATSTMALEHGVEVRSPLLDLRVVRFAATRPREERAGGRETKRLLRAAMRELLPASVLAPRSSRTGTTGAYFLRRMRAELPPLLERECRRFALAELGLIDPAALRAAIDRFLRGDEGGGLGVSLFFTLQTELWARPRMAGLAA